MYLYFFVRGWVNPDKPITQDLGISEDLFLSEGCNKNLGISVITLSYLGSTVRQILDCFSPEVTLIKIMFAVHSTSQSDLDHTEHKSHQVISRSNHTTKSKNRSGRYSQIYKNINIYIDTKANFC